MDKSIDTVVSEEYAQRAHGVVEQRENGVVHREVVAYQTYIVRQSWQRGADSQGLRMYSVAEMYRRQEAQPVDVESYQQIHDEESETPQEEQLEERVA